MNVFQPESYGPVFLPLLDTERRRPLGVGTPDRRALAALSALSIDAAFGHVPSKGGEAHPANADMAECCIAGVWLLYDFLDESHTISQGIDTTSGSFWHGIMHRREGDFSNAKYWFRHVGQHPAFGALGQRAAELATVRGEEQTVKELISNGTFDPFAFVDLCQAAVRGRSDTRGLCLDIQQAEWELLFDHCYREAVSV